MVISGSSPLLVYISAAYKHNAASSKLGIDFALKLMLIRSFVTLTYAQNRLELKRVQIMNSVDDPREGRYANYLEVGYNAFEFLLDFGQLYPDGDQPKRHTRIVTSPAYAKTFMETLEQSVQQYEESFGAIAQEDTSLKDREV